MYHSRWETPRCLLVMLQCVCTTAACGSSHSSLTELHLMTEFRVLYSSNRWRQGQSSPFLWKHKELMETKVVLLSTGWQNSYQVLLRIVAAKMKKVGHAPWAVNDWAKMTAFMNTGFPPQVLPLALWSLWSLYWYSLWSSQEWKDCQNAQQMVISALIDMSESILCC